MRQLRSSGSQRSRSAVLTVSGIALALIGGCSDRSEVTDPPLQSPVKASEWISSVNWDQRTVVTVTMLEQGGQLSYSPSNLTFEAGKPYVLRIINPAGNNQPHYISPEGLGNFYKAIATRKIETPKAEYKAPHFDAVELMVGGSLDLYFVPVLAGAYDIYCQLTGHKAAGMTGKFTIVGPASNALDLEVASDFDGTLASDARRSGSHPVWQSRVDQTVTLQEQPSFAFVPANLALQRNVGYKISLVSKAGNVEKHYFVAGQFFKTVVLRKAEDSNAEIKAPYLSAVELMVGGAAHLFVVPTQAGVYNSTCTLPDHAAKGMTGLVTVSGG